MEIKMQTALILLEISKLSILFTMFCFLFIIVHRKLIIPKYVDFLLGLAILAGTGVVLSHQHEVHPASLFYQVVVAAIVGSFTFNKYKCDTRRAKARERLQRIQLKNN